MMYGFFIGEVTNPLISLYDILLTKEWPDEKIGWLAQAFGASFVIARTYSAPMLNIDWQRNPEVSMHVKLSGGLVIMLGLAWLVPILEKVLEGIANANPDDKKAKLRL